MSQASTPIAVLMPVYNDQDGLLGTLRSLEQDCTTLVLDIFIVDDGSSPPIHIPNIKTRHQLHLLTLPNNQGIEHALNHGVRSILQHDYSYIARIDSGDYCCGKRMQTQLAYLQAHPTVLALGGYADYRDEANQPLFLFSPPCSHGAITKAMHSNSCFCHPTMMIRREAFEQYGLYSDQFHAAEDYEYFFRLTRVGITENLPHVFVQKIMAANSISVKKRRRQLLSRLLIQFKYCRLTRIHSYLGIAKTLLLLTIPNRWIVFLKQRKQTVS